MLPVGNMLEMDFDTMWNNEEYIELRNEVADGIFTRKCCQSCPSLGSGNVNENDSFQVKTL